MMIKKRCLLGILLLVAAISFVYAYLTFLQEIDIIWAGGDLATVEPVGSPAWAKKPAGKQIGTIETTDLFVVTPNANYAGDLQIRLDMTNAGELEYRFFKARTEVFDNAGAQVGRTEFVTLRNGAADFPLIYGAGWTSPYTVTITGGSFYYVGTGAGLSPAFYCQVSQW